MDPDKYVAGEQLWWDPQYTTQLTYKAVPLLRFVQFEFLSITSQEVVCLLPLRVESTNHNGSHFGMAIAMAADAAGTAVIAQLPVACG